MFNAAVLVEERPAVDFPREPAYLNGIFTGLRYQCVELARRYLLQTYGLVFDRIDNAYEIFGLQTLKCPYSNKSILWPSMPNKYVDALAPGSLIVWGSKGFYEPTGHVAVVTKSSPTYVEIIEQNEETACRCLSIRDGSLHCTRANTEIIGWKPPPI